MVRVASCVLIGLLLLVALTVNGEVRMGHRATTVKGNAHAMQVHPSPLEDDKPLVVIRKGRYSIQPSWSPKVGPHDMDIAAFDYSGVTAVVGFNATTTVKVTLFQASNASNLPTGGGFGGDEILAAGKKSKKQKKEMQMAYANIRFNATLHLLNATTQKWNLTDSTVISTLKQINGSNPTAPFDYPLFANLNPNHTYRVELQKITEPDLGSGFEPEPHFIELHHFIVVGVPGSFANILPVKRARDYSRRIEFIGDSITCGYCNLCKTTAPGTSGPDNQTFALAWANLACDALGADCHTISWSGIGMARDYIGANSSAKERKVVHTKTMMQLFNHTLATVPLAGESGGGSGQNGQISEQWNFQDTYYKNHSSGFVPNSTFQSRWDHPQAVVINLGTNDFSDGKNISKNFTRNYLELVRQILTHYDGLGDGSKLLRDRAHNEKFKIFVACGPMSTAYCHDVFHVIKESKKRFGADLVFLDQRKVLHDGNTCCGHPDLAADAELGRITTAAIEAGMGWY